MKIEKISDNKIRCTLTREDLKERGVRMSELAYGSDKARAIFMDMLQQAKYLFGFEVENHPLMIEAMPMSNGSLVMTITRVESPEELDSRFAQYAPSVWGNAGRNETWEDDTPMDHLMQAIRKSAGLDEKNDETPSGIILPRSADQSAQKKSSQDQRRDILERFRQFAATHRLFSFPSMSAAIHAASRVPQSVPCESTLLFDAESHQYYLTLTMKDLADVSAMQSYLAMISEYGTPEFVTYARQEYLTEHCRTIFQGNALQELSRFA